MSPSPTSVRQAFALPVMIAALLGVLAVGALRVTDLLVKGNQEVQALQSRMTEERRTDLKRFVDNMAMVVDGQRQQISPRARDRVRNRTDLGMAIAHRLYLQFEDEKRPEELAAVVRESLRDIRFDGGRGSFFAVDRRGVGQLFPLKRSWEGRKLTEISDTGHAQLLDKLQVLAEGRGEGFVTFEAPHPTLSGQPAYAKVAYVATFEPLGWMIGSSEFLTDQEQDIRQETLTSLSALTAPHVEQVFAFGNNGTGLLGPWSGQDMLALRDGAGQPFAQTLLQTGLSHGAGFVPHVHNGEEGPEDFLSYVRAIPEWQLHVAATVGMEDLKRQSRAQETLTRQGVRRAILETVLVSALFGGMVAVMVWRRSRMLAQDLAALQHFFLQAAQNRRPQPPDSLYFSEMCSLSHSAQEMLQDLRDSEDQTRRILENSNDGFWLLDTNQRTLEVNGTLCGMLGQPREALLGRRLYDFVDPASHALLDQQFDLRRQGVNGSFELCLKGTDGHAIPCLVSAAALRDDKGRISGSFCLLSDMTEYKRAQAELDRERRLLRILIDSLPDIVYFKDLHGVYLGHNQAYATLMGRPEQSLQGLTDFDLLPQRQALASTEADHFLMMGGKAMDNEEWMDCPDGRLILLDSVKTPFYDQDGNVLGLICVSRDITQRKQMEVDLLVAKDRAEAATRAKADFLANMSHEIRTPMNAVIGMAHLVQKTALDERQRNYVDKIQNSAQHLLGIINDILDFSKIEAGKLDVEQVDFSLSQVMDNVSNLIGEKAAAKGLELIFDIGADVPDSLIGDPLRIGQILINYANNAVKFTEQGHVDIAVRATPADDGALTLRFEVQDTGIGLNEEQIGRLFQSFQQADTSTTRKFGGTGLGLVIAKKLAELMGGTVGVTSLPGQGSNFWFTCQVRPGSVLHGLPPVDLGSRHILVVDDHELARTVQSDLLASLGFQVQSCTSGPEAIACVLSAIEQQQPFDVVMLDWHMPDLDGLETARRLKLLNLHPMPDLIMVSAHHREDVRRQAMALGFRDVINKPVTASSMLNAVLGALGRGHACRVPGTSAHNPPQMDLSPIRGASILLVEDNELNQEVACELLADMGLRVELAENGLVAVQKVQQNDYDLVLMDMQMPVMDGLTASREIRRLGLRLPIVAMTANAMQGDRERCLAAGMDDHVAKPIDPPRLWQALLRWIPARDRQPDDPLPDPLPVAKAIPPDQAAILLPPPWDGLDMSLGLSRVLGKTATYRSLLEKFLKGQSGFPDAVLQAEQAGDWDSATRLAHTLKGVAGNIGAVKLQQAAAELEHSYAAQNRDGRAAGQRQQVEAHLLPLLAHLQQHLTPPAASFPLRSGMDETPDPCQIETADPAQTERVVRQLLALLQDDDSEAAELFDAQAALLRLAFPEHFTIMERHIQQYELDLAATVLEAQVNKAKPG